MKIKNLGDIYKLNEKLTEENRIEYSKIKEKLNYNPSEFFDLRDKISKIETGIRYSEKPIIEGNPLFQQKSYKEKLQRYNENINGLQEKIRTRKNIFST